MDRHHTARAAWLVVAVALFAIIMFAMKVYVVPWIVSYGATSFIIFLLALFAFGYRVDKREGKVRPGYWNGVWIAPAASVVLFGGLFLLDDKSNRAPATLFALCFLAVWAAYNWREVRKERAI
jgi:L-lactate permease